MRWLIVAIIVGALAFCVGYGTFWIAGKQLEAQEHANQYEAQFKENYGQYNTSGN